jgi:curved DNA-binding protein CbpA
MQTHPDKNLAAGAADAFNKVMEAWDVLGDDEKRAAHDEPVRASIRAFLQLLKQLHPDQNPAGGTAGALAQFMEAFGLLGDEAREAICHTAKAFLKVIQERMQTHQEAQAAHHQAARAARRAARRAAHQ